MHVCANSAWALKISQPAVKHALQPTGDPSHRNIIVAITV